MDINDLAEKLANLQSRMLETETNFDSERAEIRRMRDEETEAYKRLREIQNERARAENSFSRRRGEVDEMRQMMRELQHELTKAQVEEATKKREAEEAAEFQRVIDGAKWREFLYEHQMFGARFGASARRWICGDGVGLGKTVQAVAWADLVQAKKLLIITPKNLTQNAIDHVKDWTIGRHLLAVVGMPRDQRDVMLPILSKTMEEYTVVINYEAWRTDTTLLEHLRKMQFDSIICDEAHKLKDLRSTTFKGVNRLIYGPNKCTECSDSNLTEYKNASDVRRVRCEACGADYSFWENSILSVKNVLLMTGTAIKNKPQEIFPPLHLINRAAFPVEKSFLENYCRQTEKGRWTWSSGGEAELSNRIKPFFLRRRRQDTGIILPPQREIRHVVELDQELYPQQFYAYKRLRELSEVVVDATNDEKPGMAANAMITYLLRLRQMVTWPNGIRLRHPKTKELLFECEIKESVKIDKATEVASDLIENGSRVLLFTKFTEPINEIKRRLEANGARVCILDGRTKPDERLQIARNFDAKYVDEDGGPKWDIALCNYGVGSEGLTLTDATDTILLDSGWNPAEREQATGRTDRIGQKRETTIHQIYCDVWIEHWQDELMRTKKAMLEGWEESVDFMQVARDGMLSGEF